MQDELVALRRKLRRVVEDKGDEERGSESWLIYVEKQRDYERLIAKHERELDELARQPTDGLCASEAHAFRAAILEVPAGLDDYREGPAIDRRTLYRRIGLEGRVWLDPEGVKLGRHGFRFEFRARIVLVPSQTYVCKENFWNLSGVSTSLT